MKQRNLKTAKAGKTAAKAGEGTAGQMGNGGVSMGGRAIFIKRQGLREADAGIIRIRGKGKAAVEIKKKQIPSLVSGQKIPAIKGVCLKARP